MVGSSNGRLAAQSFGGLTIMFSKLVTMAVNRCSLLRTVFENCNSLIYVQQLPPSEDSRKRSIARVSCLSLSIFHMSYVTYSI